MAVRASPTRKEDAEGSEEMIATENPSARVPFSIVVGVGGELGRRPAKSDVKVKSLSKLH